LRMSGPLPANEPVLSQYRICIVLASRQIYSRNRCTRSDQYPCLLGIAAGDFVTGWKLHEPRGTPSLCLRIQTDRFPRCRVAGRKVENNMVERKLTIAEITVEEAGLKLVEAPQTHSLASRWRSMGEPKLPIRRGLNIPMRSMAGQMIFRQRTATHQAVRVTRSTYSVMLAPTLAISI